MPVIPPEHFLRPQTAKDQSNNVSSQSISCVASNIIARSATNNSKYFVVPTAHTDQLKNSCFEKTITKWNQLSKSKVQAETTEEFSQHNQ